MHNNSNLLTESKEYKVQRSLFFEIFSSNVYNKTYKKIWIIFYINGSNIQH